MNCALQFALDNRKEMIDVIVKALGSPKELLFINRNHNHAEVVEGEFVIHRKGATHAEEGMLGVVPGNMKDGSFIVEGKGNKDSMSSSSHGAGRVMSRGEARKRLDYSEFHTSMEGIETNHSETTLDEAPKAYKDIFEVMELQKDLVEVLDRVRPLLNIKG
jgi:tRNA-splicing ligase RtcB